MNCTVTDIQIAVFAALQWRVLLLPLQSSLSIKEKANTLATEKVRQKLKQNNYSMAVFKLCEMLTKLADLMSMSVLDIIIKILRFFNSTRKFLFLKKDSQNSE